jgi:hypothetical protein
MSFYSRIMYSKTTRLLALVCAGGAAQASAHAQKIVFALYMVTNQDYQGDTDPTRRPRSPHMRRRSILKEWYLLTGPGNRRGG